VWAFAKSVVKHDPLPAAELAGRFLSGRPHYHMWFLYMIVGLYLCAPFLRRVVALSKDRELMGAILGMFLIAVLDGIWAGVHEGVAPDLFITWFLPYIPFFMVGYLIRVSSVDLPTPLLCAVFVASVIATALACYFTGLKGDPDKGLYFHGPLSVTVIPMSASVMYLFRKVNVPLLGRDATQKAASLTLGVYVVHPFILEVMNYKGVLTSAFSPVASIPFVTLCVFILAFIGVWIISRVPYLRRTI